MLLIAISLSHYLGFILRGFDYILLGMKIWYTSSICGNDVNRFYRAFLGKIISVCKRMLRRERPCSLQYRMWISYSVNFNLIFLLLLLKWMSSTEECASYSRWVNQNLLLITKMNCVKILFSYVFLIALGYKLIQFIFLSIFETMSLYPSKIDKNK